MFAFAREGRSSLMDEQKIERMFQLAKRVADKSELSEPLFSFRQFDPEDDFYPRNMVAVLTEGRLRNQLFASWIPITEEAYNDPTVRSAMVSRLQDFWRSNAMHALLPLDLLQGPKGKLPA